MPPENEFTRRTFLRDTPVAAAALAGGAGLQAVAQASGKRAESDVFRVGCMNLITYSHLANLWAPLINPRPGTLETPYTGMRITHCWDIDPEIAQNFAKTYECEAVKNFDDMVGKVDGVISGGYYNHPWNHVLHEPYLEAGLPNLINRPFSNSRTKARQMIETARKNGATILTPSAFEHNNTAAEAKQFAEGAKIACYTATNSFDDYPTHGIHGLYFVYRVVAQAGNPIESVAFRSKHWYSPPGVMTFEHRAPDGRPFFGTLHQQSFTPNATIRIYTDGELGGQEFQVPGGTGEPYNRTEMWAPTIWAYQRMAISGEMSQSYEELLDRNRVFMAGWRSILENNGEPVRLSEVPDDWEAPVELPSRPNDPTVQRFREKFGA